jgi:hypothetical protein
VNEDWNLTTRPTSPDDPKESARQVGDRVEDDRRMRWKALNRRVAGTRSDQRAAMVLRCEALSIQRLSPSTALCHARSRRHSTPGFRSAYTSVAATPIAAVPTTHTPA